jgi:WD40 repeat protein
LFRKTLILWFGFLAIISARIEMVSAGEQIQFRADHMVTEAVTDGKTVFAATQDGKINCFNLQTRKRKQNLIELSPIHKDAYPPAIYSLALSSDNELLVAGSGLSKIFIFSLKSHRLLKTIAIAEVENILVVRFLDSQRILLGLMDGTVRLLKWKENQELYRSKIELDPINNIRLSADRNIMAITTASSSIKIAATETGAVIKALEKHTDTIYGLAFSGNNTLFSGSKDKSLLKWNIKAGRSTVLYKSDFYINSVAWSGKTEIAFHLPDYQIGIMNLSTKTITRVLSGHSSFVNTLFFLSPGLLMSSGNDARIIIHQL